MNEQMTTASTATPLKWRDQWQDPWRGYWADDLRGTLARGGAALERMLGLPPRTIGVIPAVYFTRLRMGVVPFLHWDESGPDVELAFPWRPPFTPPPFTCFAPPAAARTEEWLGLITRVANVTDRFIAGAADVAALSRNEEMHELRVGAFSWCRTERRTTVLDEHLLRRSGVACTTTMFLLPKDAGWLPYVPLFYLQATVPYDVEAAERAVYTATEATRPETAAEVFGGHQYRAARRDLRLALRAAASAAHTRAREWLNQKTQLLNRAGFEGLKEDLQWRVARGERFAEIFFDIDRFKKANKDFTYDGADLLAARVTDRVMAYVQREVTRAYAQVSSFRRATSTYEGVEPDGFRAMLAHVSGDEFRLFVRERPPIDTDSFQELGPLTFASGLVQAAATPLEHYQPSKSETLTARHARALDASSAARRAIVDDPMMVQRVMAARPTVSAGVAFDRVDMIAAASKSPSAASLQAARDRLNRLDVVAERAAGRAKRGGRNRAESGELRAPKRRRP